MYPFSGEVWFKGSSSPLSNLYFGRLFVFNSWHSSAEHAYQWKKAFDHDQPLKAHRIKTTGSAEEAMKIGASVEVTQTWHDQKEHIMFQILMAKLRHVPQYERFLHLWPAHASFKENTKHPFWGACGGRNRLGRLHEIVRDFSLRRRDEIHSMEYKLGYVVRD